MVLIIQNSKNVDRGEGDEIRFLFNLLWWAYGGVVSKSVFHHGIRILVMAVKFDYDDLYIEVPSGSNRLFLCPLDVLNVLYCYLPDNLM